MALYLNNIICIINPYKEKRGKKPQFPSFVWGSKKNDHKIIQCS